MSILLAQAAGIAGYSWLYLLKLAVVIVGACVIVYLALRWMGVTVPTQLIQIFGVVGIVIVALIALTLVAQLL